MRHIIKKDTNPSYHLQRVRGKKWSSFYHVGELTEFLLKEQHCLCAYCENKLDLIGKHIEHVMPKSRFPGKTFDYYNLVLSCLNSDDLTRYPFYQRSCGHAPGKSDSKQFDPAQFISPLNSDCIKFFSYELTGKVEPHPRCTPEEQQQAEYTINLLNLNCLRLVGERRKFINETVHILITLGNDPEALAHFADLEFSQINGPCLRRPFQSALLQQFQNHAPEALASISI